MRVVNQITFEAKDDAEALRLAGERLGKDAVILSTRIVAVGGFLGLFKRKMLMVSAGIFQDEQAETKNKPKEKTEGATSKESIAAFQRMLEFKQANEIRAGLEPRNIETVGTGADTTKIIYSPLSVSSGGAGNNKSVVDSAHFSSAGLSSASNSGGAAEAKKEAKEAKIATRANEDAGAEIVTLREQVASLSERLDMVLKKLEQKSDSSAEELFAEEPAEVKADDPAKNFSPGLFEAEESVQLDRADAETVAHPVVEAEVQAVTEVKTEDLIRGDEYYQRLLSVEVESIYAFELVKEYRLNAKNAPFAKWLETKVPCAAKTASEALGGRKVMLIGPTGVGKTTTIAKLAAIQALWDHKKVLLLTSDTYRIAAVDQLRTYAKILGVPIEVIFEVESFPGILEKHSDAELILLDTAGRGQKDRKNLDTCEVLYDAFKPDAIHLVLSANMKYRDMQDVVKRMSVVPISRVIFTKIDETADYGSLLSIIKMLGSPVSFLTTGQNVPNDIEVASAERFVDMLLENENEES
ncbi:hypothetical protein FACS1894187_00310 [Synergistales bacterium]|nr:hypothetical protein FACS1894187_00310 [Synergistales bacterium]